MRRRPIALLVVLGLALACGKEDPGSQQFAPEGTQVRQPELPPPIERDLEAIKAAGKLVVLAPTNSTTYFLYRGEPLGYEFELLRAFAKDLGITLQVQAVNDQGALFPKLN